MLLLGVPRGAADWTEVLPLPAPLLDAVQVVSVVARPSRDDLAIGVLRRHGRAHVAGLGRSDERDAWSEAQRGTWRDSGSVRAREARYTPSTRRTVGHGSVSYVTDGSVSAFLQIAQSCRFWSPSLPNIHDTTQSHFFTEKNMSPSSARRELFGSAPAATAPPAAESSLIPGSISKQNNTSSKQNIE